jgi:hypothetical protein
MASQGEGAESLGTGINGEARKNFVWGEGFGSGNLVTIVVISMIMRQVVLIHGLLPVQDSVVCLG